MAISSVAQVSINPAGGPLGSPGGLRVTQTLVTMDNSSYTTGGVPVTPAQLGLTHVLYGIVSVRTPNGTNGPGDGALDCTNPDAPKIKCIAPGGLAETGAVTLNGAVVEVVAFGMS